VIEILDGITLNSYSGCRTYCRHYATHTHSPVYICVQCFFFYICLYQ